MQCVRSRQVWTVRRARRVPPRSSERRPIPWVSVSAVLRCGGRNNRDARYTEQYFPKSGCRKLRRRGPDLVEVKHVFGRDCYSCVAASIALTSSGVSFGTTANAFMFSVT